jgi:hypothetical protein
VEHFGGASWQGFFGFGVPGGGIGMPGGGIGNGIIIIGGRGIEPLVASNRYKLAYTFSIS